MAFAFNLPAVLTSVLAVPLILGLLGGWIGRVWRPARSLAALAIALFALWAMTEFVWPSSGLAEALAFRPQILAATVAGALSGLLLLNRVSRLSSSRPAA